MGKALLMIGGGRLQQPAVRWAREAGMRVVVSDRDPNAPGRSGADGFERVSAGDTPSLIALARSLQRSGGLAGAYCGDDFGLRAVAAIGAATGTPANPLAAVETALNKDAASRVWCAAGLPAPAGRAVASRDELREAVRELGLPVVVKPADRSRSIGVRAVCEPEALEAAFAAALRHSSAVRVEAYVDGTVFDVNGFFRDGSFVPAGILERRLSALPRRVSTGGVLPSPHLDGAGERALYLLVERAARALGITVGPVKADVVAGSDGPVLLEVAPRFQSAVRTDHVCHAAFGKSPVQAWFATLADAGGPFDAMPADAVGAAGWAAILPSTTGVFAGVDGRERARTVEGIEGVAVHRRHGHRIASLDDETATCGFLWARGRDAQRVRASLEAARAQLEVRVECRPAA